MKKILEYIKHKYQPIGIIVYGSYANGTNTPDSDFDAIVISREEDPKHDISIIDNVQLDVFVYPIDYFRQETNIYNFLHISDGVIVYDNNNVCKDFLAKIIKIKNTIKIKSKQEISIDIEWCKKMCRRAERKDAEGLFRMHWVLIDSLEIFCNIINHYYDGPKKSLKFMKDNFPEAYDSYFIALKKSDVLTLTNWINYLDKLIKTK